MTGAVRRRPRPAGVEPGDGSALQEYRIWQLSSRSLFVLDLPRSSGGHVFEVDVRPRADGTTTSSPVALYRDGVQISCANLPVTFPVPGGVIEVATDRYGLRRTQYVGDDGSEHALRPHPRSQEGLRARSGRRLPRTSAAVDAVSVAVLPTGLAVSLALIVEGVARMPAVAGDVGTVTSPADPTGWATTDLPAAGAVLHPVHAARPSTAHQEPR